MEGLLRYAELRARAEELAVVQTDATAAALVVRFDARTPLSADALVQVTRQRPGAALMPDGLRWPLGGQEPMDAFGGLLDRLRAAL